MLKTSMLAHIAPLSFNQFYMERVPKAGEGFINMYIFIELKAKPTFYIIVGFNENVEHDLHLTLSCKERERAKDVQITSLAPHSFFSILHGEGAGGGRGFY